jgi:hypothetical protein
MATPKQFIQTLTLIRIPCKVGECIGHLEKKQSFSESRKEKNIFFFCLIPKLAHCQEKHKVSQISLQRILGKEPITNGDW